MKNRHEMQKKKIECQARYTHTHTSVADRPENHRYINSYYTLHEPDNRFTNLRDMHELYCLGHLAEFAVAYHALTGSDILVNVMRRAMALVRSTIIPRGGYPGHEELELGLMRLYESTGDEGFLQDAAFFLRERGRVDGEGLSFYDRETMARGGDPHDSVSAQVKLCFRHARDYGYMQAHVPLVEQPAIGGHCVRAMYLLIGAAHYAVERPSEAEDIRRAVLRLFASTVDRQMYITGGLGSVTQSEGFGADYHLPDLC
jgi:DUF1680 family protein